ncbi:hypothetical protein K2X33_12815 [bacterium]|nr:hypothetical protein [bacterium]
MRVLLLSYLIGSASAFAGVIPNVETGNVCAREFSADILRKLEKGEALPMRDRLQIALVRLASNPVLPNSGDEAFRQLAETLQAVEREYLPEEVVQAWSAEVHRPADRAVLVDEAFRAYDASNPSGYDETQHPQAFSQVLKPPALRYRQPSPFPDLIVIPQLSHTTIVHSKSGAIEIQKIDPALRSRLKTGETLLVLAILGDAEYFAGLPNGRDLVIFSRSGSNGKNVWGN